MCSSSTNICIRRTRGKKRSIDFESGLDYDYDSLTVHEIIVKQTQPCLIDLNTINFMAFCYSCLGNTKIVDIELGTKKKRLVYFLSFFATQPNSVACASVCGILENIASEEITAGREILNCDHLSFISIVSRLFIYLFFYVLFSPRLYEVFSMPVER